MDKKNYSKIFLDKKTLIKELKIFLKLYKKRPIKDNKGGMKINHMFAFFFILRKIKPKFVIESGVFKGQGTWLIEKALPRAKIFSIDINLDQRVYISKKVKYSNKDFKYFYEKINFKNTLAFFDDHTCHRERIIQCKLLNINHIIFEDNYLPNTGDFNSLKNILNRIDFIHNPGRASLIKTLLIIFYETLKKIFNQKYLIDIDKILFRIRDRKNFTDKIIKENIKLIFEFPKILTFVKNKNLINILKKNYSNEVDSYNRITYLNLK